MWCGAFYLGLFEVCINTEEYHWKKHAFCNQESYYNSLIMQASDLPPGQFRNFYGYQACLAVHEYPN